MSKKILSLAALPLLLTLSVGYADSSSPAKNLNLLSQAASPIAQAGQFFSTQLGFVFHDELGAMTNTKTSLFNWNGNIP